VNQTTDEALLTTLQVHQKNGSKKHIREDKGKSPPTQEEEDPSPLFILSFFSKFF
jgi:hypothetical protein